MSYSTEDFDMLNKLICCSCCKDIVSSVGDDFFFLSLKCSCMEENWIYLKSHVIRNDCVFINICIHDNFLSKIYSEVWLWICIGLTKG